MRKIVFFNKRGGPEEKKGGGREIRTERERLHGKGGGRGKEGRKGRD